MTRIARIVVLIAVLAAAAGFPGAARAVVPGANGKIVAATAVLGSGSEGDLEQGAVWTARMGGRAGRLSLRNAHSYFFWGVPTFSPNGGRLAYPASSRGIMVSRADGSRPRPLTRGFDTAPAWSPRGHALAFIREGQGLYLIRAGGGGRRRLLAGGGSEVAWSPRGDELAFVTSDSEDPLILAVGLDGSVRQVARGRHVSWSRAGWLAYRRGSGLYVTRGDGSDERRVASGLPDYFDATFDTGPEFSWSPDGRRIAFLRRDRIFVTDVGGAKPRAIGGSESPCCPQFSPDGRLVAFSDRGYDRGYRVFVAPASGGRTRLATRIPSSLDPEEGCACEEWVAAIDWQARARSR